MAVRRRWRPSLESDAGLTLTELLVVVSLMGVVIAAAYGAYYALQKGGQAAMRESTFTQEISYPMLVLEKIIIQNREVRTGSNAYTLICTTDMNPDDGRLELHTIRAVGPSGSNPYGKLNVLTQTINDAGQVTGTIGRYSVSSRNVNVQDGVPLFRYFTAFDPDGVVDELDPNVATDLQSIPDETRAIVLTLKSTYEGRSIEESRNIQFRNRD